MSSEPEHSLLAAAGAIADGTAIPWDDLETRTRERSLRGIRVIEAVARAHRSLPHEIPPRGTWGPLELREPIGEGGFGTVYRAYDPVLQRDVALKLRKARSHDSAAEEARLLDEARRLARIRHPGVITIHGAESHDGRLGIWMEFVSGTTLEEALQAQGPLNLPEAVSIGVALCRSLAAVHAAGLIHRDVKTSNVMREDGGRIILMDFGSGKDFEPGGDPVQSVHIQGTPIAMPPEQLRGEVVGPATDVYSLGVLLYRLLTGRFPIEAESLQELIEKHRSCSGTPLRERRPDLPPALIQAIERALSPDPLRRFASAEAMEMALQSRVPAQRRGRRWWMVGAAAVLALSAAAAVVVRLGPRSPVSAREPYTDSKPATGPREDRQASASERPAPDSPGQSGAVRSGGAKQTANQPERAIAATPRAAVERIRAAVTLHRWRGGRLERLLPGDPIAPGDQLSMLVEGERPLYVYVINEDERGALNVLYPLPGVSPQNPLAAGERHRLPGNLEGRAIHWQVTSAGGAETILAIASKDPLLLLERDIAALPRAAFGVPVAENRLSTRAVHSLRSIGGLIATEDIADAPGSKKFSEMVQALTDSEGTSAAGTDDPWVWQIQLANP